ncbi:MAG: VIT1/CCC1 transporter family protein, partial [Deltaproteobacteria bacterium]|nr:VIT1/CCC1 transporter family protein [Deltaproteobacteria bacterium]
MPLSQPLFKHLLNAQRREFTEHIIYKELAKTEKDEANKTLFLRLAEHELRHYRVLSEITRTRAKPFFGRLIFYLTIIRLFGRQFGIKLMESGESSVQKVYAELIPHFPELQTIAQEEEDHEHELISIIDAHELSYTGSIVLGMNDALVELTGTLAGLTLALQSTKTVAIAGLITGIAASLAMAGSEYLSTKEEGLRNPWKAGAYTGVAYINVVAVLVSPYFLFSNPFVCFGWTLASAIVIIMLFAFYSSVTKQKSFRKT